MSTRKIKKGKPEPSQPLQKSANHFPVVGIGASAGGLDAFKKLIKAIPGNSGMAFVLVQHLDPTHESLLPELLQKVTNIPVLEISDDIKVQPDHIYIIPSNKMMVANDGVLQLSPRDTNKNERNLPIDLFFASLAEVHQSHSIGVVLSGTASDGTKGLKAIKEHGGITFAQSEETAAFDGMPQSAIQAGVVDFILAPELIPQKLIEITKITNGNAAAGEEITPRDEELFKQMLALLRIRKGTDFTHYKQTTIRRRILRRMALNKNEEPAEYLKFLRENKTEQDVLYQDLLIPVTAFFRDPKSIENLCKTFFAQIIKNKKQEEPIRIWVAGCSTGQEVYSIAICLKELLGSSSLPLTEGRGMALQLFATDISEPAIIKARSGVYTKAEVEGLSTQRLQDFFIKNSGNYQVNKNIRDICVFAVHNFLKDPPFGKLDLISCRNVLIYMEPYLQKKALTTFHYALNKHGFLLLGKSETVSSVPELFTQSLSKGNKGNKIFSRKDVPAKYMHTATQRSEQSMAVLNVNAKSNPETSGYTNFQKTADDILLSKYTPAGVVVNEAMDIVYFRGKTANYLEQLPGKPSHNLLKMAKEGLAFELRNILHKAKNLPVGRQGKSSLTKGNIPVQVNGNLHIITIEAMPLPDAIEPHYMILFHERSMPGHESWLKEQQSKRKTSPKTKNTDRLRIEQLENELAQLREDMRSITENQEAVNEELQSANEELLSSNEEQQSLNEELETSKEELQSTNEELMVLNQEMMGLNEQVTEARNYSENIIATLREPLLVLDKNLRVKTGNKSFYDTFQVDEKDTEGILIYQLGNGQWNIPELKTVLENVLPNKQSFSDLEISHHFPHIGQRTMLLNASEIFSETGTEKLILISFGDITERRIVEKKILTNEHRFRNLLLQSPFAVALCKGEDMVIDLANDAMKEVWGKEKNVEGKSVFELLDEISLEGYKKILLDVYHTGNAYVGIEEVAIMRREGILTDTYYNYVYQPYHETDGSISGVVCIAYEVTEQVLAKQKTEESEEQFSTLADNMENLAWLADGDGFTYWYNKRWYDFTGTTLEEMKGLGWQKVHHPDYVEMVANFVKEAWHKNEPFELTFPLRGTDGEYKWFLTRAYPMADDQGKVMRWIGTNTNIDQQKKAEVEISYRKALLEAHNEASLDGILLVDAKGKILSYNKKFIEIWNMPQPVVDAKDDEAALAHAMTQLVHPEQFIEKVKYLYENPAEISRDLLDFKDGKIVERHGYPVIADDGSYYAWSWIFRDITEVKKADKALRQSEENFRQLAELMPDKITTTDTLGNATYFNQNWLDYTGLSMDELTDWGWEKIMHPDEMEMIITQWKHSLETGEDFEMEMQCLNKNNQYKWHLTRATAIKNTDGKIISWIGTTTEIHNIKQEEKRKDDFVKMVSHELKTPVTSIKGYVQLLLIKSGDEHSMLNPSELKDTLSRIDRQLVKLTRLIAEMLDLSRIEADRLELHPELFSINTMVSETIEDIRHSSSKHNIKIYNDYNCMVEGDKGRIEQVLINLVANAIKYSPVNKQIAIRIHRAGQKQVAVSVKDDGIGVATTEHQKIFQRFYRVEGKSEQTYPGFGIGLFIANEIMKRHHGDITLKSEKGKGSTFTFTLPVAAENEI